MTYYPIFELSAAQREMPFTACTASTARPKQYMRNYWYCWFCFAHRNIPTNCELLHIYPACLCMDPTVHTFSFLESVCHFCTSFLSLRAKTWMMQHLKASYKLWQSAARFNNRFWSICRTPQGSHYFYSTWCFFWKHSALAWIFPTK